MSCTSCGSVNSNCSCSDNCPNKTSDITLFDGTFNVLEIPCNASLNDVLSLLELYTTNMSSELSSMTTYVLADGSCLDLAAGSYSLQQIMTAVIDALCNNSVCPLSVSISQGDKPDSLIATPSGGTGPYTYQWSIADNWNMWILTNTTSDTVGIEVNEEEPPLLDGCGTNNNSRIGLVKVTITDANGCVAKDTYLYINITCG
jgi:hypothetical protein